jgi:hypothetical protein
MRRVGGPSCLAAGSLRILLGEILRDVSKSPRLIRRPGDTGSAGAPDDLVQEITMTTATHVTTSTPTTSTVTHQAVRGVVAAGAVAAAVGAAVVYVYGTIAQAVEGKLYAGDPGASHAMRIGPAGFSGGVVFWVALGTLLAIGIARRASAPVRTWVRTSVVLTAVSVVVPLLASHTDESTRLTLAGAHVLAGLVAIPIVARRLSR